MYFENQNISFSLRYFFGNRWRRRERWAICRSFCVLVLLVLISACNSWPPYEKEARKHFVENRESFERLAEKMRATEYWRVSLKSLIDSAVNVTQKKDSSGDQFIIENDPEWDELLRKTSMFMVLKSDDGVVSFDPGYFWNPSENQRGFNGFTYNPNILEKYLLCKQKHERIPCGQCAVSIEGDWYVYYSWHPKYFSKEKYDSYLNADITLDVYHQSYMNKYSQCQNDGLTKMGYDVSKILKTFNK